MKKRYTIAERLRLNALTGIDRIWTELRASTSLLTIGLNALTGIDRIWTSPPMLHN